MAENKLNILYTASTDKHLLSFHRPYLCALRDHGHTVTAAAAGNGQGLPEGIAFLPVPFTKRMASLRNLRAARMLRRAVRRGRIDVVLTHTSLAAFFTRLALLGMRHRPRVVNTVHGYLFSEENPMPRHGLLLRAERLCARVTDDIVTMNREDENLAGKYALCRGRLLFTNGMGLPEDRYVTFSPEEKAAARQSLRLPPDAFVLLCAAEFSERKNQQLLLRCLDKLPEDVYLLLPGNGALLEECRFLAERLYLTERVRFPGYTDNISPYLAAADVCVSGSRSEGLPFHALEAMASGLPCVLTAVKGHVDLLNGTGAGFLTPFEKSTEMAEKLLLLKNDPALRAEMGENARRESGKYALSRVMPKLLAVYENK